jgi:hypothetical protein
MARAATAPKGPLLSTATENPAAEDNDPPLTIKRAARLLDLSPARLHQLAKDGWIPKPFTLDGVVQGYIKFLKEDQRRSSQVRANSEVQRERARKLWLENEEKEAHLVRIESAMAAIDDIFGAVRGAIAGLPSRVTADPVLRRNFEDEFDAVLQGLAERLQQNASALRAGRDLTEANPEDEPDRVGEEKPAVPGNGSKARAARGHTENPPESGP